jgi:hypothetical protein
MHVSTSQATRESHSQGLKPALTQSRPKRTAREKMMALPLRYDMVGATPERLPDAD